jgi:hypothetical protein
MTTFQSPGRAVWARLANPGRNRRSLGALPSLLVVAGSHCRHVRDLSAGGVALTVLVNQTAPWT